ncbi:hypothetical protein [Bacillus sp. USDA818B3_A]|uniref:hypothetical protein n=1 Tax=Bacillus sp. USDA818B3_A TaxID=2698834 RepID=UPI001370879F|nr:hypothetical protein [Bacillus sp. USDA818B3_A]
MNAVVIKKALVYDFEKLSDENVIEAYIAAILDMYNRNIKSLEEELLKRKLFLVALEQYDIKKTLGILDSILL